MNRPMTATAPAKAPQRTFPRLGVLVKRDIRPRLILNAVEGWGKTSTLAYAPGAAVLMARGETGYETLLNAGRAPEIPAAKLESWTDLLAMLDAWDYPDVEYIGLDALGGFERLCHEHVCTRDFKGDWGEKGFGAFQKGYDVSVSEWLLMLQKLDRIHQEHGTGIILLSHSKVRPFKNPIGPDFDRYVADCHEKTWGVTAKWADGVLFGTFQTVVTEEKKRAKGVGGTQRVLHTQQSDAVVAKNRYGMRPCIAMPDDPAQMWNAIYAEMKGEQATQAADEIPV